MKILNRKNMIEWHISGAEQMMEIRKCASQFEKGEKTVDNRDNRMMGESFTNFFKAFDDDVEIRNFMYVFRGNGSKNRCGKIIVDEDYRKIKIYFCNKEWWKLLDWNIEKDAVLELGDMSVLYVGEEQIQEIPVKLINDEIYESPMCEEFQLTEELLKQIIVLEDN